MVVAIQRPILSFRDYVRLEASSNVRHEFFEGVAYAMAGGTPEHAAIAMNVAVSLGPQIRGKGCRLHSSDLRIRIPVTGLVCYPDLTVICGRAESDPEDRDTVVNPHLLVEVTSKSTADYDRGEKLEHYQRIPSLRGIVLIAHDMPRAEVFTREDAGRWHRSIFGADEVFFLESLGASLSVNEIYRDDLGDTLVRC